MTNPPMYSVASAVLYCTLAIVRSLPLPGCERRQTISDSLIRSQILTLSNKTSRNKSKCIRIIVYCWSLNWLFVFSNADFGVKMQKGILFLFYCKIYSLSNLSSMEV